MRLKILSVFLLLWPPLLVAQFTQTQGTVTDPSGLPYVNGTITPTLVISGSPRFLSSGFPYTPPNQAVALDNKGTFVMQLADVNQLTPSGGTWSFHTCSAAGTVQPGSPITKGPVCFDVVGVVVTGSILDISSQLSAAAPALTPPVAVTSFPVHCPLDTPCLTAPSAFEVGIGFDNTLGGTGVNVPSVYGAGGVVGPILALWVNGTPVTTFPSILAANFNPTSPAAPTNGRNVQWQAATGNPATISAALVGDGSTNCLNGQGIYAGCLTGSGTNPFLANTSLELPNNSGLFFRNATNNGDVRAVSVDNGNNISIGSGGNPPGSIALGNAAGGNVLIIQANTNEVDVDGNFGFNTTKGQHFETFAAQADMSGTCTMTAGACSPIFFVGIWSVTPACVVSWTGAGTLTGILRTNVTTVQIAPSSTVGTDTATVAYICVGNPR